MTDDESLSIDRRHILAGGASISALALAGCVGEVDDEEEGDTGPSIPNRPRVPGNPGQLNEPYAFLVESVDYQNRMLEHQTKLLEDLHDEL